MRFFRRESSSGDNDLIWRKGQIQNEKIKINILKDGTLDIGNSFGQQQIKLSLKDQNNICFYQKMKMILKL